MPATFDLVLRDHGGWAGVLARSKANATRALAAEKTREAKKEAKEAEARRASMALFKEVFGRVVDMKAKCHVLEDYSFGSAEMDEFKLDTELNVIDQMRRTAEAVLRTHGRIA